MRRLLRVSAGLAVAMALAAGCGSDHAPSGAGSSSTASGSSGVSGRLTVFAAASLKQAFTELGRRFEASHPGSTVDFSFAGSSDLAAQINQGAPADVFASADTANMIKVIDQNKVTETPKNFARNTLTIVTAPGNPKQIASLRDLAKPGLQLVVCAPQVPCGAATKRVEDHGGVHLTPVSEESSVTDVLGKVTAGQADAGLVYLTDAKAAGTRVTSVPFREAAGAVNTYPIAAVVGSKRPALAHQFEDLVTGPQGRQVLADAGFQAP